MRPIGDKEDNEKQGFEEDMFLRLNETKKQKGARKAKQKIRAFDDFDDFGDLDLITSQLTKSSAPSKAQAN